jgi:hypothetical protein
MKLILSLLLCSFSLLAQHSVTLTWVPGVQTGGGVVQTFQVARGTTSGGPYAPIGSVASTVTTYVDTAGSANLLTEGATYFYVVMAINQSGASVPSNQASATIPFALPATPTSLTANGK